MSQCSTPYYPPFADCDDFDLDQSLVVHNNSTVLGRVWRSNRHEKIECPRLCRRHTPLMFHADCAPLVSGKDALGIHRYRERSNWATTYANECRRRQSPSTSAGVLWCGGGRRSRGRRRRLQRLSSSGMRLCSLSALLLILKRLK